MRWGAGWRALARVSGPRRAKLLGPAVRPALLPSHKRIREGPRKLQAWTLALPPALRVGPHACLSPTTYLPLGGALPLPCHGLLACCPSEHLVAPSSCQAWDEGFRPVRLRTLGTWSVGTAQGSRGLSRWTRLLGPREVGRRTLLSYSRRHLGILWTNG